MFYIPVQLQDVEELIIRNLLFLSYDRNPRHTLKPYELHQTRSSPYTDRRNPPFDKQTLLSTQNPDGSGGTRKQETRRGVKNLISEIDEIEVSPNSYQTEQLSISTMNMQRGECLKRQAATSKKATSPAPRDLYSRVRIRYALSAERVPPKSPSWGSLEFRRKKYPPPNKVGSSYFWPRVEFLCIFFWLCYLRL